MSSKKSVSQSPPRWIPDLFAWLFKQVEESAQKVIAQDLQEKLAGNREYSSDFEAILKAIWASPDGYAPESIFEFLRGSAPPTPLERKFIVVWAINEASAGMKGWITRDRGAFPPSGIEENWYVEEAMAWYRATGNCAENEDYIVLPAEPPAKLDEDVSDAVTNLKSGASMHDSLNNLRLMFPSEFPKPWKVKIIPGIRTRNSDPVTFPRDHHGNYDLDQLRIAFAPLVQSPSEVRRKNDPIDGVRKLIVDLDPEQERQLVERARSILQHAVDEEAHIVVMPEWVVSNAVLTEVEATIKEIAREPHSIWLVIAGTGLTTEVDSESGIPYAECVVFDGLGKRLWRQRKLHPWVMSQGKQRDAGIEPAVERGLREHFHPGNTVVVAETPIGRCVVLICEDVQQDIPARLILNRLRPRWLFVPILDEPIAVHRWPAERAKELSRNFGATVVVCNSLALLPENSSGKTADFGWMVSRSASGRFMSATVKIPITPEDQSVIRIVQWDSNRAFKRRVVAEPPEGS
uniref:Carbon-nitrogen hydrolase n=1 Tax=Candidatus Kentrum sp. LPFa TaxID=2126335 RepID=A0A450XEU4_9GAMM|nr:MAG: Carbon-nitrogen hydrolase [Candidatus Kentron sp. LPFa]